MNESIPLLITSSIIVSDPYKKVTDLNLRISSTLDAIEKWLAHSPGIQIVVCDGSGFDLSSLLRERFPNESIECLYFINNQEMVKIRGGGYGEGEIIEYALLHSETLKKYPAFAKCTSKLWVKNYLDCLLAWNGSFICNGHFNVAPPKQEKLFLRLASAINQTAHFLKKKNRVRLYNKYVIDRISGSAIHLHAMDTRFYIVNKNFYKRYFLKCFELVNHQTGKYLEHVFRDICLQEKLTRFIFPDTPIVEGLSGSTGEIYQEIHQLDWRIEELIMREILKAKTEFISLP